MKNKILIIAFICFTIKASSQNELALAVGDSLYAMGDYAAAILEFEKAPSSKIQQEKIAKSHLSLGNEIQAIDIYAALVKKFPEATILKKNYATVLYNAEKYDEAKVVFKQLFMENMRNANHSYYLGLIAEKQGDTTAIAHYKMATYINPDFSDAIYKAARFNVRKQRFFNAEGFIDNGLKLDPQSTRFLLLKGVSLFYKKEYLDAINTLEKVVALGKNTEQIHDMLATGYALSFQYKKAIEEYTILLNEYNDKNPNYHYNLGKCLMGEERFKEGISHVKLAITILDVSLHDEYVTLAVGYSREQNYQEAFNNLKLAINEDPKSEKAHYQLAVAADNFFKDEAAVLKLYENYMAIFGENGRYYPLASTRAKDIKESEFFKEDK